MNNPDPNLHISAPLGQRDPVWIHHWWKWGGTYFFEREVVRVPWWISACPLQPSWPPRQSCSRWPNLCNPNSSDALKEVLRRVGNASNVKRYNPHDPQAREWLNITMDGLPYLVCRGVINDVLFVPNVGKRLRRRVLVSTVSKAIRGSSIVLCKNLTGLCSALASVI